jgi:hypothetical protein
MARSYDRCLCGHIAYHHIAADGEHEQDCYFRFESPGEDPCECPKFTMDNLKYLEDKASER